VTLEGDVVVITGGTRGIGRACVRHAAARGGHVLFCSRGDRAQLRAVEEEVIANGSKGSVMGVTADISRAEDVERLFATARDRFGKVDAVIHNAAVSRESLLVSATTADIDEVLATNLTGSFLVAQQALRTYLEQERGGRIVFMGTISQNGAAGNASYAASKGGVDGLMKQISRRYSHRSIRANCVITGYVETELSATLPESSRRSLIERCPLRRSASPEEIAALAIFLISDRARGIEGQSIYASGGLLEVSA
jgi:3-oxoacyl-[acyl-carrier protein] reductase